MHTGEAGGIFGQSIAATASAGAAVLVWTGIALALRRGNRWRKRFRPQVMERSWIAAVPGDQMRVPRIRSACSHLPRGAYRCSLRTGRVCETNSQTASFSSPPTPVGGRFRHIYCLLLPL